MAEFNPIAPEVGIADQTGRSRGIPDDRTFETLFKGAASIASDYVNARDEEIQRNIYEDVRAETDQIQAPYIDALRGSPQSPAAPASNRGGDSFSGLGGGPVQTPRQLQPFETDLTKLQAQLNAGVVREADYDLRLFSMLKGVRSRYPGYNRQIDGIVGSVTGVQPGNALVADFFQEARAAQAAANAEGNRKLQYIKEKQDKIILAFPDFFQNQDKYTSSPSAWAKVQQEVSLIEAEDANVQRMTAQIALDKSLGNDVSIQDHALTAANRQASFLANSVINGAMNADPGFFQQLDAASKGTGQLDANSIEALNAGVQQLLLTQRQRVEQMLNRPIDDEGNTLASLIGDEAKLDGIRNLALQPIQGMVDAINNGEYGLAVRNAQWAKQSLDAGHRALLEKFPVTQAIEALNAIGGQAAVQQALTTESPIANEWNEALRGAANAVAAAGLGSVGGTLETLKEDIAGGEVSGQVIIKNIEDSVRLLTSPETVPEVRMNALEYLYGDPSVDFLNNIAYEEQAGVFAKMVNPTVAKQVFALSVDNPQMWVMYTEWAKTNFVSLFKQQADDIQIGHERRKWISLGWNPETFQFTISADPDNPVIQQFNNDAERRKAMTGSSDAGFLGIGHAQSFLSLRPVDAAEGLLTAGAVKSVKDMNLILSSMKTVMELSGKEPNVELLLLLRSMGVDLNAPRTGNFQDAFASAIQAFQDYIFGAAGNKYGPPGITNTNREAKGDRE